MRLHFKDYAAEPQLERNFEAASILGDFLEQQRKTSMMCQLINENGYQLQIGIDGHIGCAQFLSIDDLPPYYVALTQTEVVESSHIFDLGGSATEMASKYCLPFDLLKKICLDFLETGRRSKFVEWEEV